MIALLRIPPVPHADHHERRDYYDQEQQQEISCPRHRHKAGSQLGLRKLYRIRLGAVANQHIGMQLSAHVSYVPSAYTVRARYTGSLYTVVADHFCVATSLL